MLVINFVHISNKFKMRMTWLLIETHFLGLKK